jgi:hypothetical protein
MMKLSAASALVAASAAAAVIGLGAPAFATTGAVAHSAKQAFPCPCDGPNFDNNFGGGFVPAYVPVFPHHHHFFGEGWRYGEDPNGFGGIDVTNCFNIF